MKFADFFKHRIGAFAYGGIFSVKINLPTLNHVMDRLQESEQALTQDVDSVDKSSHNVQTLVSIVELMVALFPSPLCGYVAYYKHGDKECICHEVLHNMPIAHCESLDCLNKGHN